MELRHIRYFIALAEELNFSQAAKRLHIAQPPLSRQIQKLEEEIGARLFHRTKRHVELTSAGKVFLTKAYQIIDDVEQAYISTRLSSTGQEGEFRVGFSGSVQELIPTLQKYRERHPHVGIILHQMTSTEQITALNEKRIDIAVISIPVKNDHIIKKPIQKINFVAALPEQHPLTSKPSLYIRDLKDETFIMTTKSAGILYYETILSIFREADIAPHVTIQAFDLQTVLILVASGMGITIAPSLSNPVPGVVNRKIEDVDLSITPSIAWRKDNRSEILREFLAFFYES